ncbi:energy transducer TonB [uncultured Duncaniella sp.]|uniref:energy transducer TonB n=1 Tax=uncultured Duncaniella sp. TaxID=2768039 RepID=UPI0025A9EC4D|nr:energy transducer TonB [uncultured Duncaniella sp.]
MKQKLNIITRAIMVAFLSSASISSYAFCEEAISANYRELKQDTCNVERCHNVNVCDSINMPVFIVDGVEVQMQDLDSLPIEDIVSMNVVKDEAVRKIFSPRLDGIVLITTKSKRFLKPVLENYNRMMEEKEQNRIPGQLLIRGSVNENSNNSTCGNNCCSIRCDSIGPVTLVKPHQNPYYLNGGDDGLLNDLYTALSRTAPSTQDNIQGKAMFSFDISKDGIVDPNSIKLWRNRSVPEDYINAAVEAIKSLGKFEPGKLNGIPKKVTRNIRIDYPIPFDRIKTDIE